jgi:hypothetical protein
MERVIWGRWENEREKIWRGLHDLNDDCYWCIKLDCGGLLHKISMPTGLNGALGVLESFWSKDHRDQVTVDKDEWKCWVW